MMKFNSSISLEMRANILEKLNAVETDNDVRILFAIESGSRAWGFPSSDSDYDVRFVYAHRPDWYLTIAPKRDVIELPLDEVYDINGWDIKKALGLLIKPNPVMLEWLSSPIRYMWDDEACDKLLAFSSSIAHGPACLHHYLNLGGRQFDAYIDGKELVNLKKYFYIVRPAMAIKWIRLNPDKVPPMNFFDLRDGIDLDKNLNQALDALLLAKSKAKEVGLAPRVAIIDDFITAEFDWARSTAKSTKAVRKDNTSVANTLFRDIVKARL